MNFKELLEGAEPKMPGAPSGIKIMTPQQFVADAGDSKPEKESEEGVAEAVDIGQEWMSDTELDQYVPQQLQQQWRELLGYDRNGNPSALWSNLTGGYEPDVNDPQDRANMVKVANKWFAAKKIPNVKFFNVKDADDELEWLVQIGEQGVAEGYQLDEGAVETITALVKKIPGIGKYYQMAQQYKPQLIDILKTSKSGKEVKQKMERLAAGQSATVAESGMMKQLGGLAVGGGSILSTMWMNAMGMIDGVLANAAAGEVGGAVASGSILGLIPVTLMLFAAMLLFKGSAQSSDEKAQAVQTQRRQQGMAEDKELAEEFELIESIVEMIAEHNGVDAETVWEDLESLTEDELYVFAVTSDPLMEDWQKANKRDKTDGMSQKAVNAYRRENPGSKLKTAVTTKPSKLKKGGKASKRRKSYCSRSRGQMKMHSISCAKTPDKAICKARRRWNC